MRQALISTMLLDSLALCYGSCLFVLVELQVVTPKLLGYPRMLGSASSESVRLFSNSSESEHPTTMKPLAVDIWDICVK
ncbi:hypothetical protein BJY04DRAFT_198980 [Aspergillus karnatakaensis]|uniref:uncharacterized protein n=1 Tax=Aspergillus karnatakaensis TaxID=1810916 RepID=UPI003CCDFC4E